MCPDRYLFVMIEFKFIVFVVLLKFFSNRSLFFPQVPRLHFYISSVPDRNGFLECRGIDLLILFASVGIKGCIWNLGWLCKRDKKITYPQMFIIWKSLNMQSKIVYESLRIL